MGYHSQSGVDAATKADARQLWKQQATRSTFSVTFWAEPETGEKRGGEDAPTPSSSFTHDSLDSTFGASQKLKAKFLTFGFHFSPGKCDEVQAGGASISFWQRGMEKSNTT